MKLEQPAYWLLSALILISAWQALCILLDSFILPSPLEVGTVLLAMFSSGEIWPHIFASLKRTLVGFLIGLSLALLLGVGLGLNRFSRKTFLPIVELLRPIPPIAWIPLAILWFGVGDNSAFFIIFIASFFPIFTNVFFGVTSLPLIFWQVKKTFRLGFLQFLEHIALPFSLPFLLAGSKTGIGFSWMAVIAAEMISSNTGLGYFIEINRVLLRTSRVIAAMLIIGLIGYCLHLVILRIERRFIGWRQLNES